MESYFFIKLCFGTIRNNTALKREIVSPCDLECFGTIRNNTALKLFPCQQNHIFCFGTIRNNTALKLTSESSSSGKVLEPFETTQL